MLKMMKVNNKILNQRSLSSKDSSENEDEINNMSDQF